MPDRADQPHDRFFKEMFSDRAKAAAELASLLPQPLVELFDWSSLRLEPSLFENRDDPDRYSDLLFSVRRADIDASVLVFVLFEHQSTDHPLMPLRMLIYMGRIWDAWVRETKSAARPLPPILPVVLAHAKGGWRSARHFHDLFAGDPGTRAILQRFVPAFELAIDDLSNLTDEQIAARALPPATALSLWALRDGRSPAAVLEHVAFFAKLFAVLDSLPGGPEDAGRVIRYLGDAAGDGSVDVEILAEKIGEHAPAARKAVMNSVERLREEGRQQGQRAMLLELLRLKFGDIDVAAVARVERADEVALKRYLHRVLTGDSIDAVLGD